MGLDPPTVMTLSPLLYSLAQSNSPRLILALRPQDPLPDWITHVVRLGPNLQIIYQGEKDLMGQGKIIPWYRGSHMHKGFVGTSLFVELQSICKTSAYDAEISRSGEEKRGD